MDEQLRAEMNAIISGGDPAQAAPPAGATQSRDGQPEGTPAVVPTPAVPAAAAAAQKPPALDEQTSRKLALSRQAQLAAQRERQAAQASLAELAKERAALAEFKQTLERAKASGDPIAILRAHGLEPGRDSAEAILAASLGKEAPAELQTKTELAALRRELAAEKAAREQMVEETKQRSAQEESARQGAQQREYVRKTLLPELGDEVAAMRALAAHPKYGDGVIQGAIARYQQHAHETGDQEPLEPFRQQAEELEELVLTIMRDPIAAKRIQAKLSPSTTTQKPQPTPPAEETKPAPTIGKQFTGSTAQPANPDDYDSYHRQVQDELREFLKTQS